MQFNKTLILCTSLTLIGACDTSDENAGGGYTGASLESTSAQADETSDAAGDGDGDTTGDGDGADAAETTGDGDGADSGDGGDPGGIEIEPDNMIDNFEDGDGSLIPNGGRKGYWYTFNDESEGATQTPEDVLPVGGGASGTAMALHTTGSGFVEWGAGVGIDLNNAGGGEEGGNGIKEIYDVSAHTGVVVMAKGNGQVRAMVQIQDTIPPEEGGTCMLDCDPHGKVLLLSDEWQQFTLEFESLNQEGWGTPATWDPTKVVGLQFKVGANQEFDFWIDEVGFY
jgi:hypothetical protein